MAFRRTCLVACALVVCLGVLSGSVLSPLAAQEETPARPDLAQLESKILEARTVTDATIPALDILSHPDRQDAAELVQKLLRKHGLPALALLKAMAAREVAWTDVVPGVLVILGNGSPELAAAAEELVRKVWLRPDSEAGQACLARVRKFLTEPHQNVIPEIRGAVELARMLERFEDIRLLVGLLGMKLDRETRMRVATALATIVRDERLGTDVAKWEAWVTTVLDKVHSRAELLEVSRKAHADEAEDLLVHLLKSTVTGLTEKDLERLSRFFHTPFPRLTVAAAQQVGELYGAITDETRRRNVRARLVPMLLEGIGHHREEVVLAVVDAVGKLAKPALGKDPVAEQVRSALLEVIEDGTTAMQEHAVPALEGYADPAATHVANRLQTILEESEGRSTEFRVALVRTLGAFRLPGSVSLFRRLTESDPDETVRIASSTVFLQVAPDQAIQTLARILAQPTTSAMMRRRIVSELGNVITKHPAVIRHLVERLRNDQDEKVLIICADSLGYAQGKPHVQEASTALHQKLKALAGGGGDPALAASVASSLGDLGCAPAVSDLIALTRLDNPDLTRRAEEALVKIATYDVKRTGAIAAQLMAENLSVPVIEAYQTLTRDAAKAKQLNDLTKEERNHLVVLYVRALMATEEPKNLEAALAEVENLRRPNPTDADLMLLQARILHLGGPARASLAQKFLASNRPPNNQKTTQREWNILGAWAQLRLGKKDAADLFKDLYNGEGNSQDPLYWEYAIGYALALLQQDAVRNRTRIEELMAKLPDELFDRHAPTWLKAGRTEIKKALAAPPPAEKKPEAVPRLPAEKPPAEKPPAGKTSPPGSSPPDASPPARDPARTSTNPSGKVRTGDRS